MNATVRTTKNGKRRDLFGQIVGRNELNIVLDTGRAEFGIIEISRGDIKRIWEHEEVEKPPELPASIRDENHNESDDDDHGDDCEDDCVYGGSD